MTTLSQSALSTVFDLEEVLSCPAYGHGSRNPLYANLQDKLYGVPGSWNLSKCEKCNSAYLNPRPTPQTIGNAYREYFTHGPEAKNESGSSMQAADNKFDVSFQTKLRNDYINIKYGMNLTPACRLGRHVISLIPFLRERAERLVRHLPPSMPGGKLLEIGCGDGAFLKNMQLLGWIVQGIEPDHLAVAEARKSGLPIIEGVLTENTFDENSFDAITLHHVIEHLHDPLSVIRNCYRILKPNGILSIVTPNIASRGHTLFKRNWFHLDPPRHLVVFSLEGLTANMIEAGFSKFSSHASSFGAYSIFDASAKYAEIDPDESTHSYNLKREAFFVGLITYFRPKWAEEIVLTAQK